MTRKDEIVTIGDGTWTDEDEAFNRDPERDEAFAAAARHVEAEVRGEPDTTVRRLLRAVTERHDAIMARVRARVTGAIRKIRATRGARAARRSRQTKPKAPTSEDGPCAPVLLGPLTPAADLSGFIDAAAEIIARAFLARYVTEVP